MAETTNGNEPHRNEPTLLNIEDDMRQSYLDYAMSVNIGRALPQIRDGLKPVHRRILYAMFREGLLANRRYSKCAGVVGEVLKRYHPHGDMSVYDALVRMAQPFSLRYPLIDGQGNFGSVDGDPPAAYRYTECKLTRLAERMLADIDKDTVDFVPNFDGQHQEPEILPAQFPNLLVNGSDGIAVGMATNIPPHNLGEICDALLALINKPGITHEEILDIMPGPDFPTGGQLLGPPGDSPGVPHRPRYAHHAGSGGHRDRQAQLARVDHHSRDSVPGEQGAHDRADGGAGQRQAHRRHQRHPRRIRSRRHARRHRAQARRRAAHRAQPALQADPDAAGLRHHSARHPRGPSQGDEPAADARRVPRASQDRADAAHAVRAEGGRGAPPHPRRPADRAQESRRGHQADSRVEGRRDRAHRA